MRKEQTGFLLPKGVYAFFVRIANEKGVYAFFVRIANEKGGGIAGRATWRPRLRGCICSSAS